MNLKLTNPLRGSREPWPLASRLIRFAFTAVALLFIKTHRYLFARIVRRSTGFTDPERLPEKPRRIASGLCEGSVAFLLVGIGLALSGSYHALWALSMSGLFSLLSGLWLKRTVWGLPTAPRRAAPVPEVLRRLVEVIRHGYP
jgi:hypothetical protein